MATTEMTVMPARLLARTSLRLPTQRIPATGFAHDGVDRSGSRSAWGATLRADAPIEDHNVADLLSTRLP